MLDWQIFFFNNVPVWPYGDFIRFIQTADGVVPTLICTTVQPVLNGFLEVVIAQGEGTPERTFLVRTDHVLGAVHAKGQSSFGFAGAPATPPPIQGSPPDAPAM